MHDADVLRACAAIVHDHDELPGNRPYRSGAWINACETLARLIERAAEDGPVAATAGLFTRDEITAALDRALGVLRDELGLGERDTGLLLLFCRVAADMLGGEPVTLDEGVVRAWWNGRTVMAQGDLTGDDVSASDVGAHCGDEQAPKTATAEAEGLADSNTEVGGGLAAVRRGQCEFCDAAGVALVAVLSFDPDQVVCETCHDDPRLPTVSLAVVNDRRPAYVVSRGDLARLAGREVTGSEVERIANAMDRKRHFGPLGEAVVQVCGYPAAPDYPPPF